MKMENLFSRKLKDVRNKNNTPAKVEVVAAKNEDPSLDKRIELLRGEIKGLEGKDKAISTGNGFRDKTAGGEDIGAEIVKRENELRLLEKEKAIIPKKNAISELRNEIKQLMQAHKNRITGVSGFKDADLDKDPLEEKILEKEEQLRKLEMEISPKPVVKEFVPPVVAAKSVEDNFSEKKIKVKDASAEKVEEDFKYAGSNEGFGDKSEKKIDRLTESGTEKSFVVADAENFSAEDRKGEIKVEISDQNELAQNAHNLANISNIEGAGLVAAAGASLIEIGDAGHRNDRSTDIIDAEFIEIGVGKQEKEARDKEIAQLRKEMEDARKEYLQKDYEKNTAWKRLKKFFGGPSKHAQDLDHYEEDADLAAYRGYYDNKRFDLQKLLIEKAKAEGIKDEELANLVLEFQTEQKITMANEHDNVKIENQEQTMTGVVTAGIKKMVDGYRTLPLKAKVAIAVGFMGLGAASAVSGAAAVGAFGALAIAKRTFGGIVSGVGASSYLENRGKQKDINKVEAQRAAFLEKIGQMTEEQKIEILSKNLSDSVMDRENSINQIKNQDLRQLAAGTIWGAFVGSGAFGSLVMKGYNEVADYFKETPVPAPVPIPENIPVVTAAPEPTPIPEQPAPIKPTGITNTSELPKPIVEDTTAPEPIAEATKPFDGGPRVPEVVEDEPEVIPYNAENDFRKIETELKIEHDISDLDKDYAKAAGVAMNVPHALDEEFSDKFVELQQNDSNITHDRIERVEDLAKIQEHEPMIAHEEMGRIDNARKEAVRMLSQMRTEDVPWRGIEDTQSLIENGAGPKQLLKASLEKITSGSSDKLGFWSEVKNEPFENVAFNNDGSERVAMWKVVDEYYSVIGEDALPKDQETVGKWLARVVKTSLREGK